MSRAALSFTLLAVLAFSLPGCSRDEEGEDVAPPGAGAAGSGGRAGPPPETRELFAACEAGEIDAKFVRHDYSATQTGNVLWVGWGGTEFYIEVKNTSGKDLAVALPRYLLADLDSWKNPYEKEAPTPDFFYLVVCEPGTPAVVKRGGVAKVKVEKAWYLGNAGRTPPSTSHTSEYTRFTLAPAPDESPYVRLAETLRAAEPPLERGGVTLFALVSRATPEDVLVKMIQGGTIFDARRMREVLAAGGFEEAEHPGFARAEERRRAVFEGLRAGLEAGKTERFPGADAKFLAGDVEVAHLAARYLEPREDRHGRDHLPETLVELGVVGPEVLDPLLDFALRDGEESSRMAAAIAGTKLGDPRPIPILVQYLDHPEREEDEVERTIRECREALAERWTREGKVEKGKKIDEAARRFGGLDAPELHDVPAQRMEEIRAFLDSRKNLRPGGYEDLCRIARSGERSEDRRRALDRLVRNEAYRREPRTLEIFLAIVREEPDKGLRYNAIVDLHRFGDPPETEPALLSILGDYRGVGKDRNEDHNLLGAAMSALARRKSRAAIPLLLDYLESRDYHAHRAHEALSDISGLEVRSKSRADWERALREGGFLGE
ncbi:MAG: hypothetical protein HY720_23950 [Planctomycetes bacterium]|nr:hypothetical protein [Planctomycetota bacterium]